MSKLKPALQSSPGVSPLRPLPKGLIDGYTGERAALEEQLRQKEELRLGLEQELQVSRFLRKNQRRSRSLGEGGREGGGDVGGEGCLPVIG